MESLADLLVETGMIQFGWFGGGMDQRPVALHLDLLASFPGVLDRAAAEALRVLGDRPISRLLCTSDSIPFGVAVSLRSGVPLVYSRGLGEPPVDDLVGAYDIGHPAALLANTADDPQALESLVISARRVGLEVDSCVLLVSAQNVAINGCTVLPLLNLLDVIDTLSSDGRLPMPHAAATRRFLQNP